MNDLHPTIVEHFAAINRLDTAGILATFAADALVNDARREFWGKEAIAKWVAKELVGDKVSVEILEVIHHHGDAIVRGRYDGTFDRTNLPAEVILTNYFRVRDGKIIELLVIFNKPLAG